MHDDVIKWKHFPRYCPLYEEFTGHRWIPFTKACDAELWCLLWSSPEQTQTNHSDVIMNDDVSNHRRLDCLLNRLYSGDQKILKLCVSGAFFCFYLWLGNGSTNENRFNISNVPSSTINREWFLTRILSQATYWNNDKRLSPKRAKMIP